MSRVFCSFCDKSFANKYSLATHKSRYHQENRESPSTILPVSEATSGVTETKMDYPASTNSNADTTLSQEDSSNSEETSDDDISKAESSNESDSVQRYKGKRKGVENDQINNNPEETSDDDASKTESSSELESDSVQRYKGKRKGVVIDHKNEKVQVKISKLLKTLNVLLQSKLCKEEDKCIDFLFSYIMKTDLFEKFEQHLIDCGQDIATIFSMEERAFLDAVITTSSLSDVNKLMNENVNILKKMLKLA